MESKASTLLMTHKKVPPMVRRVVLLCDFKYDKESGCALVFENEELVNICTQEEIKSSGYGKIDLYYLIIRRKMSMIDAIFDGDYKEVFDDTKSIIFYANDVIFPKMPNNDIAKSNLSSFTKSELYVRLMEEQKEKKPLKSIRQIVVDLVDTQVDNYSFPVFIFDNHGTLYFINNRAVQLYFDKEDYYSDEETKRQRLEKSLKDRDDIIVVFWNVYEEI